MTVSPSPIGGFAGQFFDNNGDPLSGGKIFTYAAGTTTPQTTYTSISGNTPHANPIILDSAGRVPGGEIWLAFELEYKFVIETATGLLLGTYDNISANSNSDDIAFIQSGLGAVVRTVQSKLRDIVSVKDFGALGDAGTNDRDAFQAATDYCASLPFGGTVYIPPGIYRIIGNIIQSRSTNISAGGVDYIGAGRKGTTIVHTGTTALFQAVGGAAFPAIPYKGLKVAGMTLLGVARETNQTAIAYTLVSAPHFEDLQIEGFDYAYYLQDVDQAVFTATIAQFNNHGLFARQDPLGPVPVPNCTQPNQYSFVGATWMNNNQYGLFCSGGSNWTFTGGVISTNGQNNPSGGTGITILNPGYQGGGILAMYGTNFESNVGIADVRLISTAPSANLEGNYLFSNCSFNRAHATMGGFPLATNVILTNFGPVADVGVQKVTIDTCTFKTLGNYVPSASRPYLNWSGAQVRTASNFAAPGTIFQAPLEAPNYVQNITKPFVVISKSGNQTIADATPTIWQIDTTTQGFSWNGVINGAYQMSIPETGLYAVTVHNAYTTTPSGDTRVEILNNSLVVAANSVSSINEISTTAVAWLNAGDFISVRVTQNSGGNLILAGSATSTSSLSVYKLVDA